MRFTKRLLLIPLFACIGIVAGFLANLNAPTILALISQIIPYLVLGFVVGGVLAATKNWLIRGLCFALILIYVLVFWGSICTLPRMPAAPSENIFTGQCFGA